ncbi:hypothetical protein ACWCPQ_24695 [Nocardia sp. NPDC001965]
MSEGPLNWSASREHQVVALQKTPVVSYPFGKQKQPKPHPSSGVSTEDPRIMHGRISPSAELDIPAEEPDDKDAPAPKKPSPWHRNTAASPLAGATGNDAERAPGPIPQALALAQVRKDILAGDSGIDRAFSGRLVAERFSVGWVVYSPAVGRQRTTAIYFVTDDGDIEKTTSVADPSAYLEHVEQRFWQRQALFG